MMQLNDDPIPAKEIPLVKDLCEALGIKSQRKFQQSLNRWRRNQRTASVISGMGLTDWASERDRFNLGIMAQHYLQTEGHARKHWPTTGRVSSRTEPEYPADQIQIANLLRRVLWRQNIHAAKNAKRPDKSNLSGNDSMSAGHSSSSSSRRRSTQPGLVLTGLMLTEDSSSDSCDEDSTEGTHLQRELRRPLDLEDKNEVDGHGQGTLTKIVTLKYKQSHWTQVEQRPGGCAPVAQMVINQQSPAVLLADSLHPLSRSHPGNFSPAQTRSPFDASFEPNDDDPNDEEEDEEYVPEKASRRKRRHSGRSDATHCASKSTKPRHTSESPKLGSAGSSTMVGEEDLDDMPLVPVSRIKRRKSTNVAYDTVTASKAYYDSGGADTSPSHTSSLGPLDGSALDPEDLIQRENDYARTFFGEDITRYARGTLRPRPTSDLAASRNVNDQRALARDSAGLVDSGRSPMQASPSRPDCNPATRAGEDHPEHAAKPGVEIFVMLSGETMKTWNVTLSAKKLNMIFDHVSKVTSRNEIQRIGFYLETLEEKNDLRYFIERGDIAVFKAVIRKFNKRMDKCKDAGEARFEIYLDPHPAQQNAEKAKDAQISRRDGQRW